MRTMLRDFVRGFRLFSAQPAFAWAAVVTLALAIGANTLIFTIANILVVKPLPLLNPDRLAWILVSMPGGSVDRVGVSLPEFATFKDEVTAFETLAAWRREPATLRDGDRSERVLGQKVIGDLQGVWGLKAVRGRTLSIADERTGAVPVAVVSHQFWQSRFGGDESVVGRSLTVDGVPHTVAGILAPDIELGNLAEIDLWLPHTGDPRSAPRAERGWRPVGRLAAGVDLGSADAQVAAVAARLAQEFPDTNRDWRARAGTTREALGGANTWLILSLLGLVVGLLLLLACANVMNLLIARLIGRRQELAVRTALGATRGQVVRQIVSESLLLGLAGGGIGLLMALGGLNAIHAVATEPLFRQLAVDVRVLMFAAALSFIAPLLFSILPTLRVLRDDVRETLSEGSTRSVGSARAARGRSGLVVLQVSLAVTLLIVAGLVVQSMQAVIGADLGYDQSKLLVTEIDVPKWSVNDDVDALRLRQRVLSRVQQIPGAQAVALVSHIPSLEFPPQVPFDVNGRPAVDERDQPRAALTVVSPSYFATIDVPIIGGRTFEPADTANARPVVIISAETARRFWTTASDAPGSTIRIADTGGPAFEATVVGIARDVANPDLDQGPAPVIYVLDEHRPTRSINVIVRADNPAALAPALRAAIAEVSPDLPTYRLRTVVAAMEDEVSSNRILGGMFASFAITAILLAMAGLYGVLSYAVSQRSGEIAVRLALGAPAGAIARQIVGQSVKLTAIGTIIGLICAYAVASAIASALFGVSAADPATYAGAAVLTLSAAIVAAWIPMRRAASIDPIVSLRQS
ncbi:MAG: ABC transporter permease [Acidobacteria bacterium]|nr:ABC transporter permease [Acidobacteriota bacterium]